MRKLFFIAAVAILATACGSSKQVTTTAQANPYVSTQETTVAKRVKIEKEECQKLAEEDSDYIRGYGIGASPDQMMARDRANLAARAAIVDAVRSTVSKMIVDYGNQHESTGKAQINREYKGKVDRMVQGMAEETLYGAKVKCSNTYRLGNDYEVHVCVELTNVDFASKVHNKLTSDEKMLIDYEAAKFKEDFKAGLEDLRKQRAQGL